MAKHWGPDTQLICQVEGCREVPALGSDYCTPHHVAHRHDVATASVFLWVWIVLAGGGLAWVVLNGMSMMGMR